MTVEQLGASMDYTEYVQWIALYEVEGDEQRQGLKKAQGK